MVFTAGLWEQLLSQIQPESKLVRVLLDQVLTCVWGEMSQIRLDQSARFEGGLLSFWRPLKTTQKLISGIKGRNLILGWPDENWICLLHKHLLSSYLWNPQSAFGNQKMNKTRSLPLWDSKLGGVSCCIYLLLCCFFFLIFYCYVNPHTLLPVVVFWPHEKDHLWWGWECGSCNGGWYPGLGLCDLSFDWDKPTMR